MAQFTTDSDLLEIEPNIKEFGIQDFETDPNLHAKTYTDIIRLLNIEWFPHSQHGRYDISVFGSARKLDENKIVASQFTRASIYHVLGHYIYPRLSTFDPNGDAFQEKMKYYQDAFDREFNLILREGVKYDLDSDGVITDSEKQPFHFNRLVR